MIIPYIDPMFFCCLFSNLESFGSFPSAPDGCSTPSSRQGGGRTGLATEEVLVKAICPLKWDHFKLRKVLVYCKPMGFSVYLLLCKYYIYIHTSFQREYDVWNDFFLKKQAKAFCVLLSMCNKTAAAQLGVEKIDKHTWQKNHWDHATGFNLVLFCTLWCRKNRFDLTFFPFWRFHYWRFLLDCDMFRIVIMIPIYHSSSRSLKAEYAFWFSGTWLVKIWISWFL